MTSTETLASVTEAFTSNIAALEAAYNNPRPGFVLVWKEYWLGARIIDGKCQAARVDLATVFNRPRVNQVAFNGRGEKAVLMSRQEALRGALAHARKTYADFAALV